MAKPSRNGTIDLLRFFFCIFIVLRHFNDGMPDEVEILVPGGALAVEFFFVVSGYLMACSAYRRVSNGINIAVANDTASFMKRKIGGILPELIVASFFSIVCYSVTLIPKGFKFIISDLSQRIWGPLLLSAAGFGKSTELWYLSAMFIVMLAFYPLLIKHFDSFVRIIAPLVAIMALGLICGNCGSLLGPSSFFGPIRKGLLRAIGEIALGVAVYPVIQSLSKQKLTNKARTLITFMNIAAIACSVLIMLKRGNGKFDFICLIFMAVCAILSFSHQSILADRFDNKFSGFLGKLSLVMYLSNRWIALSMKNLYPSFAKRHWFGLGESFNYDYAFRLAAYLVCTVIACTVIYLLSQFIRKHTDGMREKLKKSFIAE